MRMNNSVAHPSVLKQVYFNLETVNVLKLLSATCFNIENARFEFFSMKKSSMDTSA